MDSGATTVRNGARLACAIAILALVGCSGGRGRELGPPVDTGDAGPGTDAGSADATVGPPEELCNKYDDDEDGQVDETCSCEVGDVQNCYPSTPDLAPDELCANGSQQCVPDGEFGIWGECISFVRCRDRTETFVYGETTSTRPVDIVWAVDQSGSMSEEIANVRANINRFASTIAASGIDYRVIMLASRSGSYGICVEPPLGGSGCTDSATFHQVDVTVSSTNALSLIQSNIAEIESSMRERSLRAFVVVTDDNSAISASSFHSFLGSRTGYEDYVFDGVIGTETCSTTARVGTVYRELAAMTGGMITDICDSDWGASFERFARDIIERTLEYELSGMPYEGTVELFFRDEAGIEIPVSAEGWHYDPTTNTIVLHDGFTPDPGTTLVVRYRIVT